MAERLWGEICNSKKNLTTFYNPSKFYCSVWSSTQLFFHSFHLSSRRCSSPLFCMIDRSSHFFLINEAPIQTQHGQVQNNVRQKMYWSSPCDANIYAVVSALCANGGSNNLQNWSCGILLVKNHLSLLRKCKRESQGCSSSEVLSLLKSTKMQITLSNPCQSTLSKFQSCPFSPNKLLWWNRRKSRHSPRILHCINNSPDFVYLFVIYLLVSAILLEMTHATSYLTSMAYETDRITQVGTHVCKLFSVSELLFFPIQVNGSGKKAQK